MLGKDHLQIIFDELEKRKEFNLDWVWFNEMSYDKGKGKFMEHFLDINTRGKCGTSALCHKRVLNARWPEKGTYLHDWHFIEDLKRISKKFTKIKTPEYLVCHVPNNLLDV